MTLPLEQHTVAELRAEGYAVIIWTPEEIGDADAGHLEDIAISRGNDYLESANSEN